MKTVSISLFAFVALACSKEEAKSDKTEPPAVVPVVNDVDTKPVVPATPPPAVTQEEVVIPTVADFEEEASESISQETLKKDLEDIEKELRE